MRKFLKYFWQNVIGVSSSLVGIAILTVVLLFIIKFLQDFLKFVFRVLELFFNTYGELAFIGAVIILGIVVVSAISAYFQVKSDEEDV